MELKPDQVDRFRAIIADVNVPDDRKDEIIHIIAAWMRGFVDRAFGLDSVQLVRLSKLTDAFQSAAKNGKVGQVQIPARIDLASEGATTPNIIERGPAP